MVIFDFLKRSNKLLEVISDKHSRITKSSENFNIYLIASDYIENNRMIFVVLPTLFEAQKYYDTLLSLVGEDNVLFFPVDEMVATSILISSSDFRYERINTIIELLKGSPKIIVTNINGILRGNLPKQVWQSNVVDLKIGVSYDLHELKSHLVNFGYQKTSIVLHPGEFSSRGSIIDFYPINSHMPIRLDFFDDELESIRLFNPETQLSTVKLKEFSLCPNVELFYDDNQKEKVVNHLNEEKQIASSSEMNVLYKDIERIDQRKELEVLHNYSGLFYQLSSITDFVTDSKIYVLNQDKCLSIEKQIASETQKYFDDLESQVLCKYSAFLASDLVLAGKNITYIDTLIDHSDSYPINAEEIPPFYGSFDNIAKSITRKIKNNYVIISIKSLERLKHLKDYFLENLLQYKTINDLSDLDKSVINIMNDEQIISLSLPSDGIYILSESTLFSNGIEKRKIRYKSTFSEGYSISSYNDLNPGDYVVHINYGIGLYEGIKTMELSGIKRDYLNICYAGKDRLYIPIEQLSLIKKYCGQNGKSPELTRLGSPSWNKTKQKVKEKVMALSQKLIELYANREASKGYAFSQDSTEQAEFESEFIYEETPDQLAAIKAVKNDMESERPMDRLICGDVGFGKTEIALRAAFKAVMDGKQVCYLAPTTVLTRQHYYTFKNRMEKYGIRVELLNRFVSSKATKQILKDLAFGSVDVLIGTHRLLSDDVKFKDLGLLITDEEQRFGVMHKEKIKEMKINVDSLMLTATPIPRTLQMSLMGIKELSMIETPPKNRYPIQTYVTPRYDAIIKEAIEREILRDGQVFYLYNYTEDIEDKAYEINRLVPEAKVCFAHGKMNKYELEQIISDFIDHKYNVLVSTTIIETGIDIPEANTLIIHDADCLGLSQLYQIRGRVGRSDKIAYAYLMYDSRKILTTDAEKRLAAIKEFTELGSGFKIAMRDLAIRGAGDLLGQEQSGFIDSVGIDLYMQILNDTLKEMRGEKEQTINKAVANKTVLANRYIPEHYEIAENLKIEIHQKISQLCSIAELIELKKELTDRFGPVDSSLELYMYEKLFNHLCQNAQIENVDIKPKNVTIVMSLERSQSVNGEFIYKSAYELSNNFLLSYHNQRIIINFKTHQYTDNSWLKVLCEYLTKIA